MNTKNRRWITPVIIIVSAAIFALSAFAASGNLSAYSVFKNAIIESMSSQDTAADDNNTQSTTMNVRYDGEEILTGRSTSKYESLRTNSGSTVFEMNGQTYTHEYWTWVENDTFHYVNKGHDDVYYHTKTPYVVTDNDADYSYTPEPPTSTELQFINALIDTVMGDTKNFFTTDGDYIVLNLEGSQIPELLQLGVSMVMESASENMFEDSQLPADITQKLTSLKSLRVDSIYVRMPADGVSGRNSTLSLMNDVTFNISLSGQDANGIRHNISMDGSMALENVGSTVADKVDLTGKNVQEVQGDGEMAVIYGSDGSSVTLTTTEGNGASALTVTDQDGNVIGSYTDKDDED